MTSDEFKQKCKKLYGTQSRAAFSLGVDLATFKRWITGSTRIPKTAIMAIECAENHGIPVADTSKKYGTGFNGYNPGALSKKPAAPIRNLFVK